MDAVQVSSLEGNQNSAQGFNPGLGHSRRPALKGHENSEGHIWAEPFCPFGAQTLPRHTREMRFPDAQRRSRGSATLPATRGKRVFQTRNAVRAGAQPYFSLRSWPAMNSITPFAGFYFRFYISLFFLISLT